jgi:hypothetical protein
MALSWRWRGSWHCQKETTSRSTIVRICREVAAIFASLWGPFANWAASDAG